MPNIDLSQPTNSATGPSTTQATVIRTNLAAAPVASPTLTGHVQLSGQSAQTLTDASAMTRGLSDARYRPLLAVSTATSTFNNNAADNVILTLVLPVGTYRFESFQRFDVTNARAAVILTSGYANVSGYRSQFDNTSSFSGTGTTAIAASPTFIPGQGPLGLAAGNLNYIRSCVIVVSTEATIHLCGGQNTASTTSTIAQAGAYMIATRIA